VAEAFSSPFVLSPLRTQRMSDKCGQNEKIGETENRAGNGWLFAEDWQTSRRGSLNLCEIGPDTPAIVNGWHRKEAVWGDNLPIWWLKWGRKDMGWSF